jgi:hypothetical protein
MPLITYPAHSPRTSRSHLTPTACPLTRAARLTARGAREAPAAPDVWGAAAGDAIGGLAAYATLASYTDHVGRQREVLALPGHGGSVLVLDRDTAAWGDRRLVAHLAPDEPLENAYLVCRDYLRDPRPRRCRRLAPEDLLTAPFSERCESWEESAGSDSLALPETVELRDRHGARHRLEPFAAGLSIPELRWCRREGPECGRGSGTPASVPRPESVRDAVARMEDYEPVRALTVKALTRHRDDTTVSVAVLRGELQRIDASRIVLNRGLRRAVLHAMRTQGLSLSEIAYRCGKVKRDGQGNRSGETSWLSRRVGISPEGGGEGGPTPGIHSEVLAVIARDGLGIAPREVEL